MNKRTSHSMTTAALCDLDPAPETVLTEAERERADATLARILATPSDDPVPVEPDRPRRRWRRLVVPAGLTAAGVAIPALLLGGGTAFGSWTPTPEPLTGADATAAATTCRANYEGPQPADDPGNEPPSLEDHRVLIAEQRGEWTYVLLATPDAEGACVMPNDLIGQDPADHDGAVVLGHYGPTDYKAPTPARDRIVEFSSMGGSTGGGWWWFSDRGWVSLVEGYVGSDVTGVTVHLSSGLDVEASVAGGRFAAWWPGVPPSSDNPVVTWSYTVTLADGSTHPSTGREG